MREVIGGTWLFGLVITFIVFFASFLAISVNYSKAFNVKNNVVDLISKYEGNNCKARKMITNYLKDTGYLVPGNCPKSGDYLYDGFSYKGYDLNGELVTSGKAYYCISDGSVDQSTDDVVIEKQYYRVMVFFKLDLPMIGDLTTFKIKGETESIFFANDDDHSITSC